MTFPSHFLFFSVIQSEGGPRKSFPEKSAVTRILFLSKASTLLLCLVDEKRNKSTTERHWFIFTQSTYKDPEFLPFLPRHLHEERLKIY